MSAFVAKHCLYWRTHGSPLSYARHGYAQWISRTAFVVTGQLLEKCLRPRINSTAAHMYSLLETQFSVLLVLSVAWIVGAAHAGRIPSSRSFVPYSRPTEACKCPFNSANLFQSALPCHSTATTPTGVQLEACVVLIFFPELPTHFFEISACATLEYHRFII
jgi:hypothetical protein